MGRIHLRPIFFVYPFASHKSHVDFFLTQIPLISQILLLMAENLTESLLIVGLGPHTDSTRFNKKIICGNLC